MGRGISKGLDEPDRDGAWQLDRAGIDRYFYRCRRFGQALVISLPKVPSTCGRCDFTSTGERVHGSLRDV